MPGCPALALFPRFKVYTQVNTMMWDLRGNETVQDPPRSPNPKSPMPSQGKSPMRKTHQPHHDTLPRPFVLGMPDPSPSRSATPISHMPTYARSQTSPSHRRAPPPLIPHAMRPLPSPYVSMPKPPHSLVSQHSRPPTPMPVPVISNSSQLLNVQQSLKINHAQARSHRHGQSHSTSGIPRAIHRTNSQQLHVTAAGQSPSNPLQRSSSSHHHLQHQHSFSSQHLRVPTLHSAQSGNRQRQRANSAGSVQKPPVVVHPQRQQVQPHPRVHQQITQHNGHTHFQYSKCTGRKKALCIGINYKGQRRELRGCINDVKHMKPFLTSHWGYRDGDIVVLIDDTNNPRQMPTRRNILDAMRWLVKDARPHDALFFHYSGHGGQIPDKDGDETDGLDEVIYPVDYKKAGIIVDDDMHRIMVKSLPTGCRLTAIFDSCHSGTALDLPYIYHSNGRLKGSHITAQARAKKATSADVISFAGCRDDQTSADTVQGGTAVGAMSYAFVTSLTRKPAQSYQELLKSVRDILKQHYRQKPQLSSSHPIDTSLRFIL